jgi:AbrB family looped-hinge helix DNA binding protein
MEPTTVTSKGQVTIPKEIRQRLGIRKGTKVAFSMEDGRIELRLMTQPVTATSSGFGMLKSPRPAVPADFDPASLLRAGEDAP